MGTGDPLSHVDIDPWTGCWNWTGRIDPNGYPRLGSKWAHRVYYELYKGPIPAGLTIDHLCGRPQCVAPYHLEATDARTNILRGNGPAARNHRRTHCRKGHEFTPENTIWRARPDRHPFRECRTCVAGWHAISRARSKAARAA